MSEMDETYVDSGLDTVGGTGGDTANKAVDLGDVDVRDRLARVDLSINIGIDRKTESIKLGLN